MVLEFDGHDSYVSVAHFPFDSYDEFTIEAWVKDWRNMIAYQGREGDPENSVWHASGTIGWVTGWEDGGDNYCYVVESGPSGEWEHVAMVFDGEYQHYFLNGKRLLIRQSPGPGELVRDRVLLLGAQEAWKPEHDGPQRHGLGQMRAFSISRFARYTSDFEPPETLTVDNATEVLYDMSRPGGDRLEDRSGKERHGTIHGASWVPR